MGKLTKLVLLFLILVATDAMQNNFLIKWFKTLNESIGMIEHSPKKILHLYYINHQLLLILQNIPQQ